MEVPDDQEAGAYANQLVVFHSPYEFTLDFAVLGQPERADAEDPESPVTLPSRVVSRVRIPVTVVFDVLRALNENMTSTRTRSARYRVWNHGIRETPR